jgi:transposase-like protein
LKGKTALRNFTGAQKMAVLLMHLKEKKSISEVCTEAAIAPSLFYNWQSELFTKGEKAFESGDQRNKKLQTEIDELKRQLAYKTQVLFELMEEHVKTKKKLGMS